MENRYSLTVVWKEQAASPSAGAREAGTRARDWDMGKIALAVALAFGMAGAASAEVVELGVPPVAVIRAAQLGAPGAIDLRDVAVVANPAGPMLTPAAVLSELPEPDVIVMMLLGLVLIGYRAGRDSSEKFK